MKKGKLILADGTTYEGRLIGNTTALSGEVVFNTSMTGYQEILTDPSYYGQIVVMTYPLIGNYGVHPDDNQSPKSTVRGFIVREAHDDHDHWRSVQSLDQFLDQQGIVAIDGIDTRAVTKKIREQGMMAGRIVPEDYPTAAVIDHLKGFQLTGAVEAVTTNEVYSLRPDTPCGKHVVVMDFGIKENILRSLLAQGFDLTVVPAQTSARDIKGLNPDGIFLSNGPGDPMELAGVVDTVSQLMGYRPIFGICLGHQLLALAYGGKTEKLPYGHRGGNHPVKDYARDKVFITSQNHGYVVVETSLDPSKVQVTHRNVNDGSIEGLAHKDYPIFSVQYHPEASPGPKDSAYLFEQFHQLLMD